MIINIKKIKMTKLYQMFVFTISKHVVRNMRNDKQTFALNSTMIEKIVNNCHTNFSKFVSVHFLICVLI